MFDWVWEWGLCVNKEVKVCQGLDVMLLFYEDIMVWWVDLGYDIDGVVYKVDWLDWQCDLGFVSWVLCWVVVYKFLVQEEIIVFNEVDWQVGCIGVLILVVKLELVQVGGVMVSNVILYNIDEICWLDICVGDSVVIYCVGDVIFKVVCMVFEWCFKNVGEINLFMECLVCGSEILCVDDGVVVCCIGGLICGVQQCEVIKYFVLWWVMDIDGLGDKLVDVLVDQELIEIVVDFYCFKVEDVVGLECMGEKFVVNLIEVLEVFKKMLLSWFLFVFGILQIGEEIVKVLVDVFGDLDSICNVLLLLFLQVFDVGGEVVKVIVVFFVEEYNEKVIDGLFDVGVELQFNGVLFWCFVDILILVVFLSSVKILGMLFSGVGIKILEILGCYYWYLDVLFKVVDDGEDDSGVKVGILEKLVQGFKVDDWCKILKDVQVYVDKLVDKVFVGSVDECFLEGEIWVFIGILVCFICDQVKQYLEVLGVKVFGSVFGKIVRVVVGEFVGFKLDKVCSFDVEVIDEDVFIDFFVGYGIEILD